jgi:hypothetical protein
MINDPAGDRGLVADHPCWIERHRTVLPDTLGRPKSAAIATLPTLAAKVTKTKIRRNIIVLTDTNRWVVASSARFCSLYA